MMVNENNALEINELSKVFRNRKQLVRAVDNVNLSIRNQEIVGLVGESGSGKSTLGKSIAGLIEKTSGEIKYRGKVLPTKYTAKDFQSQATEIQMIFQDPYSSLNPRMTVGEIVGEGLRSLHTKKQKDIQNLESTG